MEKAKYAIKIDGHLIDVAYSVDELFLKVSNVEKVLEHAHYKKVFYNYGEAPYMGYSFTIF